VKFNREADGGAGNLLMPAANAVLQANSSVLSRLVNASSDQREHEN
jgi:hypothetical protein